MADESNGAEATDVTAEGRLRAAGFINSVGFWKEPGGERLFDTVDAIAALDAGEYPAVDRTLVIPTLEARVSRNTPE